MIRIRLRHVFGAISIAMGLSAMTHAADTVKSGVMGTSLEEPSESRLYVRCPAGQYLVGVGENLSDRMIGYWYECVAAGATPETLGRWSDDAITTSGPGDVRRGQTTWKRCPRDYFIIGLKATSGEYGYDSHGMAAPKLPRLIADLQPLCRQLTGDGYFYQTQRSYFEGGDDNELQDISWGGLSSDRACSTRQAAVGMAFRYRNKPNQARPHEFADAALICDKIALSKIRLLIDAAPP